MMVHPAAWVEGGTSKENCVASTMVEAITLRTIRYGRTLVNKGS
ncbi:MAG: hypothetical protein ACI8RD_005950 [Bacillariaceae sp.]|jgi:hypothetical protein